MPAISFDGATLLLPVNVAEQVRGSAQTLLNALNNNPQLDVAYNARVVVASTKGFNTPVTSVRVGRVVDVIRSRRSSIPEAYTAPLAVS
jgi:hypothetical protein